ncbi:MAG: hypothetical protein A2682_00290 [Candidatus Terrybacteria bacterium RIFCSPHIGHO2_01_FULL_58_15]|uniref:histidine kinase n=1 Tax=Terrybacteria sp. (strain RIFCSPHIGHO2_01_FULL_58_15) TaxID=1802363 RepID=A0A1G2PM86_TERXR|nr:MAG: hypothetical protein A2682_00290 [Candidatus Terrybacteria bacterium RIFCSPHIGHO2_01_FULL_58_15]
MPACYNANMQTPRAETLSERLLQELNLVRQCQHYPLPLWQCPQMLFVVMGGVTVGTILVFYFIFAGELDPYSVALTSLALAGFLLVQTFIIIYALERTAEANRIQVDFMNIVSHQLRTPVTAARWALELLTKEAPPSGDGGQYVIVARNAIHQMQQLVASILGIARIESGLSAMRAEPFSLRTLVSEAAESFKKYARTAHVAVRVRVPDEDVEVRADRSQVRFVLEHLLDNSLRYSRSPSEALVTLEVEGSQAKVSIEDRGEGIPRDDQAHVFERFFRASNAYALAPGGAGLSLYVSRAIIEASKGRIGFTSSSGRGSTFWFTLPMVSRDFSAAGTASNRRGNT